MKWLFLLIGLLGSEIAFGQTESDYQEVGRYIERNSNNENAMTLRAIRNMRKSSEERAERFANELAQYASISESNDPERVLEEFKAQRQKMEQMIEQRNTQLVEQGFQAVDQISSLSNSSSQSQVYSALGSGITTIEESIAAKKEAEAQRAALQREKQRRMLDIRNDIIEQNNAAIRDNVEKAAYALNPDEENFYMEVAYYFTGHNNYINQNFSYSSSSWAANPYREPELPHIIPNSLKSTYQKYTEAANRKHELYLKNSSFPVLNEAALKFANGALHEKKNSVDPYLLIGKIAKATDLNSSYSALLIAEKTDARSFKAKGGETLLEQVEGAYEQKFKSAVNEKDYEFLSSAINLGLHKGLKVDGKSTMLWAISADEADLVQLLINKDVEDNGRDDKKLAGMLAYASLKDASKVTERMVKIGVDPDLKYRKTQPVIIASRSRSINSLKSLWAASDEKLQYQNFFAKPSNAKFATGYKELELMQYLAEGNMFQSKTTVNWFYKVNKPELAIEIAMREARLNGTLSYLECLSELKSKVSNDLGNEAFLDALARNEGPLASALYTKGFCRIDARPMSDLALPQLSPITSAPSIADNSQEDRKQALMQTLSGAQSPQMENLTEEQKQQLINNFLQSQSNSAQASNSARLYNRSTIKNEVLLRIIDLDMLEVLMILEKEKPWQGYEQEFGEAVILADAQMTALSLASLGINPLDKGSDGGNLFHKAAYLGSKEMIMALANTNPNILNSKGPFGWTALHYSSKENDVELTTWLLDYGADDSIEDEWGRTARDIAKEYAVKYPSYDALVDLF